jgi:hypothetical protein
MEVIMGIKEKAQSRLGAGSPIGTPTITVGEEAEDVINVAIQLVDKAGSDLAVRACLLAYLSDDANGDSVCGTKPSTDWAIGTDGLLLQMTGGEAAADTGLVGFLISESDGDIDINITETGTDTFYLILVMPDGTLVASGAITFAA